MKEHGVLLAGAFALAAHRGTKTVTRRPVAVQPIYANGLWQVVYPWGEGGHGIYGTEAEMRDEFDRVVGRHSPLGVAGDRLWVRETWAAVHYWADPESGRADDWDAGSDHIPRSSERGYWTPVYAADPFWTDHVDDRGFAWRPSIHMPRWASRTVVDVVSVRIERLHEITDEDARAEGLDDRDAFAAAWQSIYQTWADNPLVWRTEWRPLVPGRDLPAPLPSKPGEKREPRTTDTRSPQDSRGRRTRRVSLARARDPEPARGAR